jgi:predicted ATPase
MLKLKKIRLANFGGYEDTTFDFQTVPTGPKTLSGQIDSLLSNYLGSGIVPISMFFGPNGIGKSTVLEAIRFVSNPTVFKGRQQSADVYLRPWVRDTEYIPLSDHVLEKQKSPMRVEAVFTDGERDYDVFLTNTGFEKMELPPRPEGSSSGGYLYYVDADNPLNWARFQLIDVHAKRFVELAEAIYGYECDLDGDVKDQLFDEDGNVLAEHTYYQDLIVTKGKDKVHYARMSAGEKKIATMIRMLCNPDNTDDKDILLIDNMEMHVYFKRHPKMIEKLREYFPTKQIIATTHSKSMIDYGAKSSFVKNFDLEEYRPEYKMLENTENEDAAPKRTGYVCKEINTPNGPMNVWVPANSDKLKDDPETGVNRLQSLVDNAVKLEIDGMGKLVHYEDPNASQFKPGTGQVKRAPERLSPAQQRRKAAGEDILVGPVTAGSSGKSLEDFDARKVGCCGGGCKPKDDIAVVGTATYAPSDFRHTVSLNAESLKAAMEDSLIELNREPVDTPIQPAVAPDLLTQIPERAPTIAPEPEKKKGFWAKVFEAFKG